MRPRSSPRYPGVMSPKRASAAAAAAVEAGLGAATVHEGLRGAAAVEAGLGTAAVEAGLGAAATFQEGLRGAAAVEAGLGAAATVQEIPDLGKLPGPDLTGKKGWRERSDEFVEQFFDNLRTARKELYKMYNSKCYVTWQILGSTHSMRSSEEIMQLLAVSVENQTFILKNHVARKLKRSIHIVTNGLYKVDQKSYNFVQAVVIHHETSLVLNEVLVIMNDAMPVRFVLNKEGSKQSTDRRIGTEGQALAPEEASKNSTDIRLNRAVAEAKKDLMVIYNPACLLHIPPKPHASYPECPDRITDILARLEADGVRERVFLCGSEVAERRHILAVHKEEYVAKIDEFPFTDLEIEDCPFFAEEEMYCSAGTKDAVYLAAGAAIKACDAVFRDGFNKAFALVRPPGHHASADFGEGFCYINNAAVAANYLLTEYDVKSAFCVDIDVHHGNGSQSIFYQSDAVMVFSTHCQDLGYPRAPRNRTFSSGFSSIGEGAGKGYNVNVPLKQGFGDSDLLHVFEEILIPLVKAFKPGAIIVSAGFDAAIEDTLGKCSVSHRGYGTIAKMLAQLGNGKLILLLEGGYGKKSLPVCVSNFLRSLLGDQDACLTQEEIKALPAPQKHTREIVQKVLKLLKTQWGQIAFRH